MILENNKTIDEEKKKGLLSEQEEKILIVDDEKDIRKLVGIYLKKQGYKILEAENGQMAVDIMKEHSDIDLVIMDITMPNMDGLEALKAIRAKDNGASVVMCSAMGQESMVMDAVRSGAKDFIVKPFKPDRVLKTVNTILGAP